MQFVVNTQQLRHMRQVFTFGDWIGNIGGILELYYSAIFLIVGGFLSFNVALETITTMYHI